MSGVLFNLSKHLPFIFMCFLPPVRVLPLPARYVYMTLYDIL